MNGDPWMYLSFVLLGALIGICARLFLVIKEINK